MIPAPRELLSGQPKQGNLEVDYDGFHKLVNFSARGIVNGPGILSGVEVLVQDPVPAKYQIAVVEEIQKRAGYKKPEFIFVQ